MPVCRTLAYRRLCDGNSMVQEGTMWPQLVGQSVESTFGWGREAVRKGLAEAEHDVTIVPNFDLRGRKRSEVPCAD